MAGHRRDYNKEESRKFTLTAFYLYLFEQLIIGKYVILYQDYYCKSQNLIVRTASCSLNLSDKNLNSLSLTKPVLSVPLPNRLQK